MKKQLLLASVAMLGASSIAQAQLPNPAEPIHTDNLTLEWYAAPTGTAAIGGSARSGIGINGKFYVAMQNVGVAIFNKDGQFKTLDNKETWVSINVDDAGHVYFRNDKGGWAGPEGAGWYLSENARFCIIDSKTDEIIKSDIPMKDASKCRFDALPHVMGDMTKDNIEIPVTGNGGGNMGYEFIYDAMEQTGCDKYNIGLSLSQVKFPNKGQNHDASIVNTLGSAQLYSPDEYGYAEKMAVLSNNVVDITASAFGWGNNVAVYKYDEELGYVFADKWLNTPNHSAIGGFCMFRYAGKNYICYPAGTTADGNPSGDGFFVMEEEFVDTPINKTQAEDPNGWYAELKKAKATKYATDGIITSQNYRGINVEPVEGEDGKFTIYHYNPGISMEVWTLDLSGSGAGIEDIVAEKGDAKIFGGRGVVVVDGADNAQVYNTAGQLVRAGKGSIAVNPGIYVVKAGQTVGKVIVR